MKVNISIAILLCFSILVHGMEKAPELLFEAGFDNYQLSANRSAGNPNAETQGRVGFKPGFKGGAVEIGEKGALKFKADGNYSYEAGTVEFYFKLYPATEKLRMLFSFYSGETERFYVRQCTENSIQVFFRGPKGGGGLDIPFLDQPAGSWHHLAFCWRKKDDKTTNVKVYLNGLRRADKDMSIIFPDFKSGIMTFGSYFNGMQPLNGLIDEVKIYDGMVYTEETYPEFFNFPSVAPLEQKLREFAQNLPLITHEKQAAAADKKFRESSGRLEELKKPDFPKESYLAVFSEIENGINGLFDSYLAPAKWWRDKEAVEFKVLPVSPMLKIDNRWSQVPKQQEPAELFSAGHEWQAAQLLVLPHFEKVENCRITVGDLKNGENMIDSSNFGIFTVGTVSDADDPLKRSWPDPIYPLKKEFDIEPETVQPVWLQVYIPAGTAPGKYEGTVTVATDRHRESVPVSVSVYDFSLPVTPRLKTSFGFAVTSAGIAKQTPQYLANMLKYKVSPKALWRHGFHNRYFLAPRLIKKTGGEWRMDFSDYDRQLDQLLPLGLNTIMVGHRAWDGNARAHLKNIDAATAGFPYYNEETGKDEILTFPVLGKEAEEMSKFIVKNWYGHLESRNLAHMAYTYLADEPYPEMMPLVNTLCGWVKEVAPELKNMITQAPAPNCPNVDIWCPLTPQLPPRPAASGQELWTYVCCAPLDPHPNFFMGQTGLQNRLPFWIGYKHGAGGFLYYETARTLWLKNQGNEWKGLVWDGQPGTEGDGILVYPGPDGPVNTIRFEYVRLGIQDIEYFLLLKELAAKLPDNHPLKAESLKLLEIDNTLIKSSTEYCRDWSKFEQRRRAIGKLIEQVQKELKRP